MVIISKRSPSSLEWANAAAEYAPNVWAHRRAMLWWSKLSAVDQDTVHRMVAMHPKGWKFIASWPEAIAGAINALHPEVFNDHTGKSMLRFLESEAGAPYRTYGKQAP